MSRKIKLKKGTEPTPQVIKHLIKNHSIEKLRIQKLNDYYKNKNDILNRTKPDPKKPNNKLAHGFSSYITNMATGYFIGTPVSYKAEKEKELLDSLTDVFKYNDEQDVNSTLSKQSSIQGYSYELLYADEDANPRFTHAKAEEMIVVHDTTIAENIQFAIRYFADSIITDEGKEEEIQSVEVYTKNMICYYTLQGSGELVEAFVETPIGEFVSSIPHSFGDVPVVVYVNNDELYGDFEKQLSLINAYDNAESDTANDLEYFTNCLLVVSGIVMDAEDTESLTDDHVINFDNADGKAEYLIKNIQDTAVENYKNRLDNDIHKFSQIPNLSDESFSNNASGVSLGFKLTGLEYITGIKESKFRKGLMRRIELLCNFLSIKKGNLLTYTDIEIVFTRTIPRNEKEVVEMLKSAKGIYSDETILSLSPHIQDVGAELEKLKGEQNEMYPENYSIFDSREDNTKVVEDNE